MVLLSSENSEETVQKCRSIWFLCNNYQNLKKYFMEKLEKYVYFSVENK